MNPTALAVCNINKENLGQSLQTVGQHINQDRNLQIYGYQLHLNSKAEEMDLQFILKTSFQLN